MDANTNIDALRRKHKKIFIERAMGLYRPADDTPAAKEEWLNFLLKGNAAEEMIQNLKNEKSLKYYQKETYSTTSNHFSSGRVTLIDKDLECYASGRRNFLIEVTNNSPFDWQTTSDQPLFIAYHWHTENGETFEFDSKRTSLSQTIPSEKSLTCEMQVIIPNTPGHYLLEPTMVLEGNFWMEEKSLITQKIPIRVEEYNGDGLTRHARNIYQALKKRP